MDMLKRIIKIAFFTYLIYVLIFSTLIFSFHKPTNKEDMEENLSKPLSKYRINDRVALIESGEEAISVRLSLIENAQTSINLSYYKFADGEIADLILGSLLEAADRGVKVKILLDGIIQLGNIGKKNRICFYRF